MHQDYQKNFYELIYHKNAKFFLKKFIEGTGVNVFMSVINMPEKEAYKEAKKLGKAVERYTRALYQMDVRAKRYKESFNKYINQPQVIASAMNYILNTLYSLYPQYYLQLFTAIASNIFQGEIHLDFNKGLRQVIHKHVNTE